MQNPPDCTSYIWKMLCPFSNPQTSEHTKSFSSMCGWLWWIVEAQSLSGAFGTWWPKLPSAGVLLLRTQSGRERLLLVHPTNHPRRTSTEEMETIQWTQAQVEHNYARSAYTEQRLHFSGVRKVLWKDGMGCNAILIFMPSRKCFPTTACRWSLFSNTSTWDGTSHLARKIQNVSFWEQYMHVFKTLNYKDTVIPAKVQNISWYTLDSWTRNHNVLKTK